MEIATATRLPRNNCTGSRPCSVRRMHIPLLREPKTNVQHTVYRLFHRLYIYSAFSPRTHRARMIAAKRMAASNSTALAEILASHRPPPLHRLTRPLSLALSPTLLLLLPQ